MKSAIAIGLLLSGGVALAAPSRADVERLLGGYENRTSAEDIKRLGPGVDHVLVVIAIDPATNRLRRNRALTALASVPSVEGRDLLRSVIRDYRKETEGAEVLDLAAAARSMGSFGAEAAMEVVPLLAHPTSDVRLAAADALAAARAVDAAGSLRLRLSVEREGTVVKGLVRALDELSKKGR